MIETIGKTTVPVNVKKLLENQLKKWQGGGHHARGIAEYISNSDDSYRRLRKYLGQSIIVEIHSRNTKKIEKLIIRDNAEGMSFDELENKFFQYFESFSGWNKGEKVTGRFGTGGKAYAIMNFRHCWLISVRDGKECKAWFKWDEKEKEIIKGYNNGGYKDKKTNEPNGTTIILESSLKVSHPLRDFIVQLEKLPRIRHILKSQKVFFRIIRKGIAEEIQLKYSEPDSSSALRTWRFSLPDNLKNENEYSNELVLRYFEKPLGENAFIDLTDGISSIEDLQITSFDGRPFSKYINGQMVVAKLMDSSAVKENRRGLEEGDDLTDEIKSFIKEKVSDAVSEVEEIQRKLDKERRINAANEKLNELSKFLSKQDLKFKLELKELKKRILRIDDFTSESSDVEENPTDLEKTIYRKPIPEDSGDVLIKGNWFIKSRDGSEGPVFSSNGLPEFIPNENGSDFAVKIGAKKKTAEQAKRKKQGINVLFSNDPNNSDSPTFKDKDDPVSDRDLVSKGIIWINAVHPIIIKYGEEKINDAVRNENIANFVLMIVAQYYAQKEIELQPEEDPYDPLLLFRKHFFKLQMDLRTDLEVSYFEKNNAE
jgi:hypothetical protein